jgi:hypothetical protein
MQDLYNQGWDAKQLAASLERPQWIDKDKLLHSPFATETFRLGSADLTLKQICDMMDVIADGGIPFAELMRARISTLLNVEYEAEVAAEESQREYVWSLKQAIERRETA